MTKEQPTDMPLNFESSQQRTEWIVQHARYFTMIYREDRRNVREEAKTLDEARSFAKQLAKQTGKIIMIYAVGPSDYSTWVENVKP